MKKRLLYATAAIVLFFGLGIALDFGISKEDHLETYVRRIERSLHKKEAEVQAFLADTGFIYRQLEGVEKLQSPTQQAHLDQLLKLTYKDYNIRLYKGDSLLFWLNNKAFISGEQLREVRENPENNRLVRLPNGHFLLVKAMLPNGLEALAMLPIKKEYSRESEFLPNRFITDDFTVPNDVHLKETGPGFAIHTMQGKPIAYIDATGPAKDKLFLQFIFFIYVLGFISSGVLVNDLSVVLVRRYQPWVGAAFVLGTVIAARWLIIKMGFAQHFASFETFSDVFTAPILEGVNSLGELLINIILLVWLMVFFNREFRVKEFKHPSKPIRFGLTVLNFFSINLGILMVCYIFKSIILDSRIVFDFENVFNLNSQSVLAMMGVVMLLLALFLFSHRMMLAIHGIGLDRNWRLGALVTSILLSTPVVTFGDLILPIEYFLIASFIYLVVFELFIEVRTMTLEWLVIWLMLYAGLTSMLLYMYNSEKDFDRRKDYAKLLADYQDPSAEEAIFHVVDFMLGEAFVSKWDNLEANFPVGFLSKEDARDLVENAVGHDKYLLHNYDFTFSAFFKESGKRAFFGQAQSFGEMEGQFYNANQTKHPMLRFRPEKTRDSGYLLRIELKTHRPLIVFIFFKRAFSNPSKVYTELLLDKKYKKLTELESYDYGIYQDGKLIEERNRPYAKQLADTLPPVGEFRVVKHTSTRSELLYHDKNGIAVKIGRETGGYIKPLSLFSYVFSMLTFAVVIFAGINYYINALPGPLNFFRTQKPSLRNQFQFWVISMILFSFMGIGFVTVWYFQQSSNEYHKGRLDRKVTSALANINFEIKTWYRDRQREWERHRMQQSGQPAAFKVEITEDAFNAGNPDDLGQDTARFSLSSLVPLISEVHRLDVNIFDLQGNLITSSEEDIFRGGLISTKMGAYAFQVITHLGHDRCDQDESIGTLEYTAAYLPLRDYNKNIMAFMGIPYYARHRELSADVRDFMSTLLNVYVFLLLIAGGLAIFVANSVTKALSELSDNIQRLRLGGNQPIVWKRRDEIGDLVDAYNRAVKKIEESSRLLAQSEREGAWREMAKQVAHEIKNPLTPMKLSIQYLLHAYQSNPDPASIEPLLKRVSNTLVEQIESLAQIATEFSNFAKMPKAHNVEFSLNDLATSVHHLFHNERPDMDITIELPDKEYDVFCDKNHVTRVLNNLYKNAIQAIPDERKGVIKLSLYERENTAVIEVSDNGSGIPADIQEKVFTPNFSTKTSGTGLGLAICKSIIEGFNGTIYFKTEQNIGTTFFIELPIMDVREKEPA